MLAPATRIYLVAGVTDMRKSIDGLAHIVPDSLQMDPLNDAWYIFCNRQRDKLKILFWDSNGFWLYYRRLEKGRFKWPAPNAGGRVYIRHSAANSTFKIV